MGRERRKWTPDEDRVLREAVEQAERASRPVEWQSVASRLPGRTNKDCRKRWHNSLADSGNEGIWSPSEDERLRTAVQRHGTKWARVAHDVGTRNGDQCSKRWSHSVDPSLDRSPWSKEEASDQALLACIKQYGHNWQAIVSNHLHGRSALSAKNRHFLLNRKSTQTKNRNSPDRGGIYSQTPADIYAMTSGGNSMAWPTSPITTSPTMTNSSPYTRTFSPYYYYNSTTPISNSGAWEPSQATYPRTHIAPGDIDMNPFFPSDVLQSGSSSRDPIIGSPRSFTLRKTPTASSGSSAAQGLSPDSTAPSYPGSFHSHQLSHQSSPPAYHSAAAASVAGSPPTARLFHTASPPTHSYAASTSTAYTWPGSTGSTAVASADMERAESGSGFESETGGGGPGGHGMRQIWVRADCAPDQVEPLMQSINTYSRNATFLPDPGAGPSR